jgi:hypothetical protein
MRVAARKTASRIRRSPPEIAIWVSQVSRWKISLASRAAMAMTRYVPQAPLPPTSSKLRTSAIASSVSSPSSTRIPNTPEAHRIREGVHGVPALVLGSLPHDEPVPPTERAAVRPGQDDLLERVSKGEAARDGLRL